MGCASSTPMVTTAGGEMLKAATHVADDAAKSAENAVQGVTHELGKTIETAKETVGTAVTGVAHELGAALKEKTDALDEAKTSLMEKLHLGGGAAAAAVQNEADAVAKQTGSEQTATALARAATNADAHHIDVDGDAEDSLEHIIEERASRAPTPADSLKTTTPEPEIEHALANVNEDSPPTPKPTLAELEQLTTAAAATATAMAKPHGAPSVPDPGVLSAAAQASDALAEKVDKSSKSIKSSNASDALPRPSTTEWERYADGLALNRKYNPYEAMKRGGNARKFHHNPSAMHGEYGARPAHRNGLRDDDSLPSDPYYNSYSSALDSHVSSAGRVRRGRMPTRPIPVQRFSRENTAISVRSMGRSTTTVTPLRPLATAAGRKFDFNPNRSRIGSMSQSRPTSPVYSVAGGRSRATSPAHRRKFGQHQPVAKLNDTAASRSPYNSPVSRKPLSHSSANTSFNARAQSQPQPQPQPQPLPAPLPLPIPGPLLAPSQSRQYSSLHMRNQSRSGATSPVRVLGTTGHLSRTFAGSRLSSPKVAASSRTGSSAVMRKSMRRPSANSPAKKTVQPRPKPMSSVNSKASASTSASAVNSSALTLARSKSLLNSANRRSESGSKTKSLSKIAVPAVPANARRHSEEKLRGRANSAVRSTESLARLTADGGQKASASRSSSRANSSTEKNPRTISTTNSPLKVAAHSHSEINNRTGAVFHSDAKANSSLQTQPSAEPRIPSPTTPATPTSPTTQATSRAITEVSSQMDALMFSAMSPRRTPTSKLRESVRTATRSAANSRATTPKNNQSRPSSPIASKSKATSRPTTPAPQTGTAKKFVATRNISSADSDTVSVASSLTSSSSSLVIRTNFSTPPSGSPTNTSTSVEDRGHLARPQSGTISDPQDCTCMHQHQHQQQRQHHPNHVSNKAVAHPDGDSTTLLILQHSSTFSFQNKHFAKHATDSSSEYEVAGDTLTPYASEECCVVCYNQYVIK